MAKNQVIRKWIRNKSDELAVSQGCTFDLNPGTFVCEFIEGFCRQSKGKWAGQPIVLMGWQRDFLMRLFGWRLPDGRRRFRRFYLEIAKKNGKSTLLSGLAIAQAVAGDEGPEVYVNAADRGQASIIFDEAARMVRASPDLRKRIDITDSRKVMTIVSNNGRIRANSADANSNDGLNPSDTFFDELHRQPDRRLWEVFEFAGAARDEPLLGSITTAGEDDLGVWYEQREYSERVNDGTIPDITHLGIVYRALPEDDIDDPATWRKANPSMGTTIREEDFERELQEAKRSPAALANFQRLRLNIITRENKMYVSPATWDACGRTPTPTIAKLRNRPAYGGLDLSSVSDLSAFIVLIEDDSESFDVLARFWLPEENIVDLEHRHRVPYRAWADAGYLKLTNGARIDYSFIRAEINELAAELDLRKVFIDPANAQKLATELAESDGIPVEFLRQGFLSLNGPTKELDRLLGCKKIRHGNHPVLTWNARNAVAEIDAAGNVKLSKSKSRLKIDGMAALVNAIAARNANTGDDGEESVYEQQGIWML